MLIANTTETEFKSVLDGLCGQTKGFKAECTSIVDQYYVQIYDTLVRNLSENEACCAIEICPRQSGVVGGGDLAPLLPAAVASEVSITARPMLSQKKRLLTGDDEPKLSAAQIQQAQLPFDTLMGAPNANVLVKHGSLCPICQYVLHAIQDALSTSENEEKIKVYVERSCQSIRSQTMRTQCVSFIETYGDAMIALFVQEMAPRDVCPHFYLCPAGGNGGQVEVFEPIDMPMVDEKVDASQMKVTVNNTSIRGTEKCPLCLFAVQAAVDKIQSNKSKENIRHTLNKLCVHLPQKLQLECTDFVETYTNELLRMLAEDFTPQDICVSLKLCDNAGPQRQPADGGDICKYRLLFCFISV